MCRNNFMIYDKKEEIKNSDNKFVWCNKRNINIRKRIYWTSYKISQEALDYIKNNVTDSDGGMYLSVDSSLKTNNMLTSCNNITLRKVNVKSYGFDKIYMDKELVEDKLYQITDQLHERKITSTKFYSLLLNKIHPFYDGNSRTCTIMFANNDIIKQNI